MEPAVALRISHQTVAFVIKLAAARKVLLRALGKVILIDKIVARIIRRVYVPTDFDTIEKAFSGVKTAEKGIKQGLSRSITDSESPFSLYSVVDFCRSKVRRHRGV